MQHPPAFKVTAVIVFLSLIGAFVAWNAGVFSPEVPTAAPPRPRQAPLPVSTSTRDTAPAPVPKARTQHPTAPKGLGAPYADTNRQRAIFMSSSKSIIVPDVGLYPKVSIPDPPQP